MDEQVLLKRITVNPKIFGGKPIIRGRRQRRRSLKGLWSDLGAEVSSEDIAEVRREMWGGFPRGDV